VTVPASCVLAAVLAAIASVGCGTETLDSPDASAARVMVLSPVLSLAPEISGLAARV